MATAISSEEFSAFRSLVVGLYLKISHVLQESSEHSIPVDAVPNTTCSTAFLHMNTCSFPTGKGLARHQVAQNRQEESASNPTETASSISSKDTSAIDSVIWANLPPFLPVNPIPTQAYNIPGADLAKSINALYEEIITWRKNLFPIPFGQQGKSHTALLSEWLTLYNNTSFQGIALKVFMVIPALMMQKPFTTTPPFKGLL